MRDTVSSLRTIYRVLCLALVSCAVITGCSTTQKIKDGKGAYESKQYARAIEMLETEIKGQKEGSAEYARMAYLLGDSYKQINDSNGSLKWFLQAAKHDYGPEAYIEMAYALKKKERYEDAILTYQRLGQLTGREREIRQEIAKCQQAIRLKNIGLDENVAVDALSLNSEYADYAPAYYRDGMILFTSDRGNGDVYDWTGNAFSDLYIADMNGGIAEPFEPLNSEHNEGAATFSLDRTKVFFTRCYRDVGDSYCTIYTSQESKGSWSEPQPLFVSKVRAQLRDPVLIENDSVLVFTSDFETGVGGHDLYYAVLEEDGSWSDPDLMPIELNTIGHERYPTWDQETKTLYYSSDHIGGLGGLDIYKTTLSDQGKWSKPTNMEPPINSSEDDFSLIYVPREDLDPRTKMMAFFTSTRGIFGNDDIYQMVEKYPSDYVPPVVVDTVEVVEETPELSQYFLKVNVVEKKYALRDNPNSFVVGYQSVPNAQVKINDEIQTADANGAVAIPMDSIFDFRIVAGKEDYLTNIETYRVPEADRDGKPDGYVFDYTIFIEREFAGVEIVLDNIYYDLDKADIREDAKPGLDRIVKMIKDNPEINIELASHTDCQGEEAYNLDLSKRRAASAVAYIQSQYPASEGRLTSRGYGESNLEINCACADCTEEEHQINRRTTFKIVR